MKQVFTIPGRLDCANDYIKACRTSRRCGAKLKRENDEIVAWAIKAARLKPVLGQINVTIRWIEKNMKRDKDNIRFGVKFILDALVETGIIPNDNWTYIGDLRDVFTVDRTDPRIVVEIEEV